jgi:hypothetical protein
VRTSPTLVNRTGAFPNTFTTCWIIINFYPDGKMEIENLADREEWNFPFRQEILDQFLGKELGYDSAYAENIV